jgi:hypothetical protein
MMISQITNFVVMCQAVGYAFVVVKVAKKINDYRQIINQYKYKYNRVDSSPEWSAHSVSSTDLLAIEPYNVYGS